MDKNKEIERIKKIDNPLYTGLIDKKGNMIYEGQVLEKYEDPQILYLCDRTRCENCSYPLCKHTNEIQHAKNFKQSYLSDSFPSFWEVDDE